MVLQYRTRYRKENIDTLLISNYYYQSVFVCPLVRFALISRIHCFWVYFFVFIVVFPRRHVVGCRLTMYVLNDFLEELRSFVRALTKIDVVVKLPTVRREVFGDVLFYFAGVSRYCVLFEFRFVANGRMPIIPFRFAGLPASRREANGLLYSRRPLLVHAQTCVRMVEQGGVDGRRRQTDIDHWPWLR